MISTIDLNNTKYLAESIEHIKNYKNMKSTNDYVEN
jgi:hypothetical protein